MHLDSSIVRTLEAVRGKVLQYGPKNFLKSEGLSTAGIAILLVPALLITQSEQKDSFIITLEAIIMALEYGVYEASEVTVKEWRVLIEILRHTDSSTLSGSLNELIKGGYLRMDLKTKQDPHYLLMGRAIDTMSDYALFS